MNEEAKKNKNLQEKEKNDKKRQTTTNNFSWGRVEEEEGLGYIFSDIFTKTITNIKAPTQHVNAFLTTNNKKKIEKKMSFIPRPAD